MPYSSDGEGILLTLQRMSSQPLTRVSSGFMSFLPGISRHSETEPFLEKVQGDLGIMEASIKVALKSWQ